MILIVNTLLSTACEITLTLLPGADSHSYGVDAQKFKCGCGGRCWHQRQRHANAWSRYCDAYVILTWVVGFSYRGIALLIRIAQCLLYIYLFRHPRIRKGFRSLTWIHRIDMHRNHVERNFQCPSHMHAPATFPPVHLYGMIVVLNNCFMAEYQTCLR